jgi:hypothetical protein
MGRRRARTLKITDLWPRQSRSLTAEKSLDQVLGATVNLPLKFWRPRFYFTGAPDETLHELSGGEFPAAKTPARFSYKTHPILALKSLPDTVGFKVSPCSSQKPYRMGRFRYIRGGCRLRFTGHVMDRDSFIIDTVRFNIPPSVAYRLRFFGEVPEACFAELTVKSRLRTAR